MRTHTQTMYRQRFTLIELLVVIAIIIVLAGILLPVMGQARARAKMTSCTNQLSQFGMALVSYRDDHENRMVPWMSNLFPDYGTTPDLYICPSDPSGGFDGSRPGAGWGDNTYGGSPISIDPGSQTSPDGDKDQHNIIDERVKDEFFNTDDTIRNQWRTTGNDSIERSSYLYEFADVECTWASNPPFTGTTWNEVKHQQLAEGWYYDGSWQQRDKPWEGYRFPSTRCFYHYKNVWGSKELVLNTSYDGGYFKSKLSWEEGIWD